MIGTPMTFAEAFYLPLVVDLGTAARALGICSSTAYRLIHSGNFPCHVIQVGTHYRIPTAFLLKALGIEQIPIYEADLEGGVKYASQEMEEDE
ncbi:helix-turn-helix domain-containing protein [Nonomuraea angiospora]|uniref:Excisionase family DNA binding protein n=1 Tax=Nonomuraea angiospora TaxID=46172 RepID=A0ABR9M4L5_9ACTN|nr:helix-turn-helix domain-containing protein [Nonomuraea angiospora]MBE1587855.1 excisionase family DNA binding protein [Nonomuraea angiospora]